MIEKIYQWDLNLDEIPVEIDRGSAIRIQYKDGITLAIQITDEGIEVRHSDGQGEFCVIPIVGNTIKVRVIND